MLNSSRDIVGARPPEPTPGRGPRDVDLGRFFHHGGEAVTRVVL
jgi:hypothetical protein